MDTQAVFYNLLKELSGERETNYVQTLVSLLKDGIGRGEIPEVRMEGDFTFHVMQQVNRSKNKHGSGSERKEESKGSRLGNET